MRNLNLLVPLARDAVANATLALDAAITDAQLIDELAATLRVRNGNRKTVARAQHCLRHYSDYLHGVHDIDILGAELRHVVAFLDHLTARGGERPDASRLGCPYCLQRGFPDPHPLGGWAPSTRKAYFSYLRLLYGYTLINPALPSRDPTAGLTAPRVDVELGATLERDELRALVNAPGPTQARLIGQWLTFVPTRVSNLASARWQHVDLTQGSWTSRGKGGRRNDYALHPLVVAALRDHRETQLARAHEHPKMRRALERPDTAYVLMSRNGRPLTTSAITKSLKRHAIRAGVRVVEATSRYEAVGGMTSLVSPHMLRRSWAHLHLNDPDNPLDGRLVMGALDHISESTLRHYARPKDKRVNDTLRAFEL